MFTHVGLRCWGKQSVLYTAGFLPPVAVSFLSGGGRRELREGAESEGVCVCKDVWISWASLTMVVKTGRVGSALRIVSALLLIVLIWIVRKS